VIDDRVSGALVGKAVHVEPVVEPDPKLDDTYNEDEQRDEDEGELDHRLTALAILAKACADVVVTSHEVS
jgi:hypothetical protein